MTALLTSSECLESSQLFPIRVQPDGLCSYQHLVLYVLSVLPTTHENMRTRLNV